MPYYLKLAALAMTISGFILALVILLHKTIMHHPAPFVNLSASQKSVSLLLDLIWLENVLSKSISHFQTKISTLISDPKGLFFSLFISLALNLVVFNFHK